MDNNTFTKSGLNATSSGSKGRVAISNSDYVVGITVAILGNMCISFSYQFQKLAHKRNVEKRPYTSLPLWWLGLSLMVFGEIGNFLAYGWAPATVVSPLGAASVIVNALLAHVLLKERLSKRNMLGVMLAILGAVVISLTAPKSTLNDSEQPMSLEGGGEGSYIYRSLVTPRAFVFLVCVVAAALFLGNPCLHPLGVSEAFRAKYVWANCGMCGLLGAITVMGAKGVSTALGQLAGGDVHMFTSSEAWLTYLLVASAVVSIVGQIHFLNKAMMSFGASEVVPVYFVLFTLSTVCAGMVLYMEVDFGAAWRGVVFVMSIAVTFVGVYLIQDKRGLEFEARRHVELHEEEDERNRDVEERLDAEHPPLSAASHLSSGVGGSGAGAEEGGVTRHVSALQPPSPSLLQHEQERGRRASQDASPHHVPSAHFHHTTTLNEGHHTLSSESIRRRADGQVSQDETSAHGDSKESGGSELGQSGLVDALSPVHHGGTTPQAHDDIQPGSPCGSGTTAASGDIRDSASNTTAGASASKKASQKASQLLGAAASRMRSAATMSPHGCAYAEVADTTTDT